MVNLETMELDIEQASRAVEGQLEGLSKVAARLKQQLTDAFSLDRAVEAMQQAVAATGRLSGQLAALRMNFGKLKATLARAVEPLGNLFVPVLNRAVMALTGFARELGELMGSFFGIAHGAEGAASAQKQLEKATISAGKAAKRSLASFDALERLSGGSGGSTAVQSPVSAPEVSSPELVTPGLLSMAESIRNVLARITGLFAPSVTAWGTAFSALGPVVEAAAVRVAAAWTGLWENSLAPFWAYLTGEWIPGIVNAFSQTFAPVFAQVMPALVSTATAAFQQFGQLAGVVTGLVQQAFEGAKTAFTDMCTVFTDQWNTHDPALLEGMEAFSTGVGEIFWNLYTAVLAPVADGIAQTLGRLWDKHLKPLWDKLSGAVLSLSGSLLQLWNAVLQPVIGWLIQTLSPAVQTVANTVMDILAAVLALAADVIGGGIQLLDGLIRFLTGVFTGNWEQAWAGVVKVFEGLFSGITGIVKGVINTVITGLNTLVGAIYSAIAAVVNGLGGIVGTVGDMVGQSWGFRMPANPPRIPYLAQGAVLPANQPFLAVVGDQRHGTNIEAPLATIQEAVRLELSGVTGAMLRGMEALLEENRLLRQTVEAIEVGDTVIGQAAARYAGRQALAIGGRV